MQESTQIIEQVASKSKKTSDEVRQLIEEKKSKFSGLLTDSGAAYMVAKDLGIEVGHSMKRLSVSQLKDGMQNIDLLARVMQIFSPKQFEKGNRKGVLCNLVVADSTGEIRLTVWHDDVKKLLEKKVKRGTTLLLRNCYVKSFNEKPQISLAYNGSFIANPKNISFEDLPEAKSELSKISQLKEEMNNVNLNARILRKFPATQFEREGRKGKVMNFLIGDETGVVRATAWNDLVDLAQNRKESEVISIEGAYTKPGLKGIELHLGWQARLVTGLGTGIPSAAELMLNKAEKKRIVELGEGNSNVLVEGKIVLVNQGGLYYSVCPKCSGKVQRLEEGTVCDKCGEVKEPDIRPVISVRLDDGSAQINAVAYGKEAEKIIGLEKDELRKQAEERGREALLEELQATTGRQIRAVGRVKQNSFSNELELVANLVEIK